MKNAMKSLATNNRVKVLKGFNVDITQPDPNLKDQSKGAKILLQDDSKVSKPYSACWISRNS